ncbi:MAG: ATP-dependent DNA helicase [Flavobacterium sp.]
MNNQLFYNALRENFPFQPTEKQLIFFKNINQFLLNTYNNEIFLLKGYAGTGKTSVVNALVKSLPLINFKIILLAPTGRAAKVLSQYTQNNAFTIHKKIYFTDTISGKFNQSLQQNKHINTLFVVDEASMLSNESQFQQNSLLEDVIHYVYSGKNCKLLLIGDDAQLPPVFLTYSPALNKDYLKTEFFLDVLEVVFNQVMRQSLESGILYNATLLRLAIQENNFSDFSFITKNYPDIIYLSDGYDIENAIQDSYQNNGIEETTIIVRSNKRANLYNQQIRNRILGRESDLSSGDLLMVIKNNYFWLGADDQASFIANGDILEVQKVYKVIELYGFTFAKVKVNMLDYPNQNPFDTVLILDAIAIESASLSQEQLQNLFVAISEDYQEEKNTFKRNKKVKENEFYNALQVKFSYCITCHKSQGGQWNTVFVEKPYLPDGISIDYLKWLYTACSRAKEKLYLIGF